MMDMLTRSHLRDLFRRSSTDPAALAKSEDETLEYKASFSFDEKLMKAFAAFANNRGGYFVFGVEDSTRRLVGLNSKQLNAFDRFDVAKITQSLNSFFAPSIRFSKSTHVTAQKSFGVIYVYTCSNKPVIATKSGSIIKDGDIYYSFGGRRQRIGYAQLQAFISERISGGLSKLLDHWKS